MIPRRSGAAARAAVLLAAVAAGSLAVIAAMRGLEAWLLLSVGSLAVLLGATAAAQWWDSREQARLQREVANGLAHQVRTPLAHIRAYCEMLLLGRDASPEERHAWLAVIEREAHRLEELTENLLFAVATPGPHTFPSRGPTDLGALIEDVAVNFAETAAQRDIRIEADPPAGVLAVVEPRAVRQAVSNLLDNALRHGTRGTPVSITLQQEAGLAVIRVANQGPPIPRRDRERIWQPFVHLRPDAADAGCGLGLAQVQHVARMHGGRAYLEYGPGGETRFSLALPTAPSIPSDARSPSSARAAAL